MKCYSERKSYTKRKEYRIGQKLGVLEITGKTRNNNGEIRWICKCDCGNVIKCQTNKFANNTAHCGRECEYYVNKKIKPIDVGFKSHKLAFVENDVNDNDKVIVNCDCGTVKSVNKSAFRRGLLKSCGCLQRENRCDNSVIINTKQKQKNKKSSSENFDKMTSVKKYYL